METYLHIIQSILSDWLLITLNNPVYAIAIAIAVFLLTAIIYSIRIASLNEQIAVSEKARLEMENQLNTAQQQRQHMQEELIATTGQMEQAKQLAQKEAERAGGLEEQLSQRNQRVAGIIQNLATSFDLGERPLPVMGDIKAEGLWQQHDRVVNLLSTRLQSEQQAKTELQHAYQAETAKRAEKEALLETMQATLASQTIQLSKLEQALEEQKSQLQEQQEKAQQVLSQTLEKHLAELARITELEQQTLDLVNTRQQLTQLEEKLTAKEALITQLEKDKSVEPDKTPPQPAPLKQEQIETIIELPKAEETVLPAPSGVEEQVVSSVKEQTGGVAGKLKGLFGKTKQEPITAEPEAVEIRQVEEPINLEPVEPEEHPVAQVKEQTGGVAVKLKGMFGKTKQEPISAEPEAVETRSDAEAIQAAPVEEEQPAVSPEKSQLGKLKNLFGSKQQPEETKQEEPDIQPVPVAAVEQLPVSPVKDKYGRIKHYFGDKKLQSEDTKQDDAETQPAALEDKQPPESAAKGQLGKLKNLFGSKQKSEDTHYEEAQPAPSDVEQPPVNTIKIPVGKLKNLFGSKPKSEESKQAEETIQPAPVEVEQPSVSPAKGQLGKLKNLFGKAK